MRSVGTSTGRASLMNKNNSIPDLDIDGIQQLNFPNGEYYRREFEKKQAIIHHTVSGTGPSGDISTWIGMKYRIATCVIIGRDGTVHQCFSTRYWAHHLGVKESFLRNRGFEGDENIDLNRHSVAIELDSYGGLERKNGVWKSIYGHTIDDEDVIVYSESYRGHKGFERYTDVQIKQLQIFLNYLGKTYDIPMAFDNEDIFDVNDKALSGEPGIWTHTSYRPDKSDCHPQPELIDMLYDLEQGEKWKPKRC